MLKGIAAICLALGLLTSYSAEALHKVPSVGMEATIGNVCYNTKEYYEEINKVAKNQGFQAGKDKYWEVMSDKDTPCYVGVLVPVILVEMINETKNLRNAAGKCFHSQIWEVLLVSDGEENRKAYTNWHINCSDLNV